MWKNNTVIMLSAIIVGIRSPKNDLKRLASWVHALSNELRRLDLALSDANIPKVVSELEALEAALHDLDAVKALQHAEAAKRLVAVNPPELSDAARA